MSDFSLKLGGIILCSPAITLMRHSEQLGMPPQRDLIKTPWRLASSRTLSFGLISNSLSMGMNLTFITYPFSLVRSLGAGFNVFRVAVEKIEFILVKRLYVF